MSWQDAVNGSFEMLAGIAVLHHCLTLYHDKMVRGASLYATTFFTSWGFWNLYYYPSLDQWASFVGGLFIVSANALWLGMMWHYRRR